jgi:very-short-patch-repair endonuclease
MVHNHSQDAQPGSAAPRARQLRKTCTDTERALWMLLRDRQLDGAKFRRQRPFGPYILDFYCVDKRLAIEADGSQHLTPQGMQVDRVRTDYLEQRGILVLRFTDWEILLEREGVLAVVQAALAMR